MALEWFRGDGRVVMAFGSGFLSKKFPNSRKGARVRIPFTATFFIASFASWSFDPLILWDELMMMHSFTMCRSSGEVELSGYHTPDGKFPNFHNFYERITRSMVRIVPEDWGISRMSSGHQKLKQNIQTKLAANLQILSAARRCDSEATRRLSG